MISSATSDRRLEAVLVLGALAILAGCGGGRNAGPSPEIAGEAPVVARGAADSTVVDRSTAPQDTIPAAAPKVATPASLPEPILASDHLISGYRVQIFTSSWLPDAEKLRDKLRGEGIAAYVEYRSPLYRVRIGDCMDLAEARELRDRAVALGYDRATIVSTLIQIMKKSAQTDGAP